MGVGYMEGVTHNYIHHSTTILSSALDLATDQVMSQRRSRHRPRLWDRLHLQKYPAGLSQIDKSVPTDLDLHLIVNNFATNKHPNVRAWVVVHPRFHQHYTPTYGSWV